MRWNKGKACSQRPTLFGNYVYNLARNCHMSLWQSRSCQGMLQRSAANNDQAAKVDNEARKNFDQAPSAHLGCCMFGCIKTIQIAYGLMIGSHGEGERNSGSAQLSAKSRAGLCDKLGALRV